MNENSGAALKAHAGPWKLSGRALAKKIFQAELPEHYVRSLPAQSLYMAVKQVGLSSCEDLIQIVTIEQCRLFLDFDCWKRDRFCEERFWEWLSLGDAESGLELLQKILKAVDLKLVALLIARYMDVITFEEPTENPPAAGFYTPDKGYTWVGIKLDDGTKHLLLARFIALIFETNAELFYQLLATPGIATPSMLEEEAYQERLKRLSAEGVPEPDYAAKLHSPFSKPQAKADIAAGAAREIIGDIPAVEPILHDQPLRGPLAKLVLTAKDIDQLQAELTLLMNAAVVHWRVNFSENEEVLKLAECVKGAIDIGIELALKLGSRDIESAYETFGLIKLYRLGIGELLVLRRLAMRINTTKIDSVSIDEKLKAVLHALCLPFPQIPAFFSSMTSPSPAQKQPAAVSGGKLPVELKAIESLQEIENLMKFLRDNSGLTS